MRGIYHTTVGKEGPRYDLHGVPLRPNAPQRDGAGTHSGSQLRRGRLPIESVLSFNLDVVEPDGALSVVLARQWAFIDVPHDVP